MGISDWVTLGIGGALLLYLGSLLLLKQFGVLEKWERQRREKAEKLHRAHRDRQWSILQAVASRREQELLGYFAQLLESVRTKQNLRQSSLNLLQAALSRCAFREGCGAQLFVFENFAFIEERMEKGMTLEAALDELCKKHRDHVYGKLDVIGDKIEKMLNWLYNRPNLEDPTARREAHDTWCVERAKELGCAAGELHDRDVETRRRQFELERNKPEEERFLDTVRRGELSPTEPISHEERERIATAVRESAKQQDRPDCIQFHEWEWIIDMIHGRTKSQHGEEWPSIPKKMLEHIRTCDHCRIGLLCRCPSFEVSEAIRNSQPAQETT